MWIITVSGLRKGVPVTVIVRLQGPQSIVTFVIIFETDRNTSRRDDSVLDVRTY